MSPFEPDYTDPARSALTRRSAVRLLAGTGLALFAGAGTSSASLLDFLSDLGAVSLSPSEAIRKYHLDSDWFERFGSSLSAYSQYIAAIQLRNLSVRQVIIPHTHRHGSVANTLPPRAMWKNIRSTLKVVDKLTDRLDVPVTEVVSVYRCPAYNAKCPGAKSNSYHLRNNAIDMRFGCPPGKVAAMARAMRASGLFAGGVGRYSNFTHIDTRGSNADW